MLRTQLQKSPTWSTPDKSSPLKHPISFLANLICATCDPACQLLNNMSHAQPKWTKRVWYCVCHVRAHKHITAPHKLCKLLLLSVIYLGANSHKVLHYETWQGAKIHVHWDTNHWAHRKYTTTLKVKKMAVCTCMYSVMIEMHLSLNGPKTTDPILTQPMTPGTWPRLWQRKCTHYVPDLITWRARPGIRNCWTKLPASKHISVGAWKTGSKTLWNWNLWS